MDNIEQSEIPQAGEPSISIEEAQSIIDNQPSFTKEHLDILQEKGYMAYCLGEEISKDEYYQLASPDYKSEEFMKRIGDIEKFLGILASGRPLVEAVQASYIGPRYGLIQHFVNGTVHARKIWTEEMRANPTETLKEEQTLESGIEKWFDPTDLSLREKERWDKFAPQAKKNALARAKRIKEEFGIS